jgi:dihydrolipoamide dehydrogenase
VEKMKYNVIIIGAGPGGYSAAVQAAKSGLSVLLVEKDNIGGVCLNEGCMPTKTLLYSAKILESIKTGAKYGVTAENITFDHVAALKRKDKTVKILTAGIKKELEEAGVVTVFGSAVVTSPSSVEINGEKYNADNIIIATGSSPLIPEVKGAAESCQRGILITSKEALCLTKIPDTLTVIGGGVVGLEIASYFNSAGSKVTVIEALSQVGGAFTDKDIAQNLEKNYDKKGIVFNLSSRVMEIEGNTVNFEKEGKSFSIQADKILMSIGRTPNINDIGLDVVGVEHDRHGIKTDGGLRTNVKGIYALGDVNGRFPLAHTAYAEAGVCVANILGGNNEIDYNLIPSVIYTNPETASVGATEESLTQLGTEFYSHKIPMRFSGRYLAENEGGDGFCKIITDKERQTLLGVHMISNYVSEIIVGAEMMLGKSVSELKNTIFPHPTVGEVLREALYSL